MKEIRKNIKRWHLAQKSRISWSNLVALNQKNTRAVVNGRSLNDREEFNDKGLLLLAHPRLPMMWICPLRTMDTAAQIS